MERTRIVQETTTITKDKEEVIDKTEMLFPCRFLSIVLYYWAYVRSLRLFSIAKDGLRKKDEKVFSIPLSAYHDAVDLILGKSQKKKRVELEAVKDGKETQLWNALFGNGVKTDFAFKEAVLGEYGGWRGYLPAQFYFIEGCTLFRTDCHMFRMFLAMPEFYWATITTGGNFKTLRVFNCQDTECFFIMDAATSLINVTLHGDARMSKYPNKDVKNVRSEDILGVHVSIVRPLGTPLPDNEKEESAKLRFDVLDIKGFPQIRFFPGESVGKKCCPLMKVTSPKRSSLFLID
jgi:hypothetical protein